MGKRHLFKRFAMIRKPVDLTSQDQDLYADLNALAQDLTPDADFKDALAEQLLNAEPPLNTIYPDFGDNPALYAEKRVIPNLRKRMRVVGAMVASMIVMLMATLFVPSLRTFATDILNVILDRTPSDLIVFEYHEPDRVVNQAPLPVDQYTFFSSIARVNRYVDFNVLEPHAILESPPREIVYIDDRNMVSLVYGYPNGGWLEIQQQPVVDMLYWRNVVGASADVTQVELQRGDEIFTGEYVQGGWTIIGDTDNPAFGVGQWADEMPIRRLRWFEADMVYEVQIWEGMPRTPEVIPLAEMIQIAESLR